MLEILVAEWLSILRPADSGYIQAAGLYQIPVSKRVNILCQTMELWNQDDEKVSGTLRKEVAIRILPKAPPSFVSAKMRTCAVSMTHEIELVGYRSGALRRNKRVTRTITVLPQVAQADTDLVALQKRWDGPWKQAGTSKHLRRCWLWGRREYAETLVSIHYHLVGHINLWCRPPSLTCLVGTSGPYISHRDGRPIYVGYHRKERAWIARPRTRYMAHARTAAG